MARLFTVVGPSGVGKDTVMNAALDRCPEIHRLKRVITRDAGLGGEDFEGVTEAEFEARAAGGAFAVHWRAHGLRYGLPVEMDALLAAGQDVVFNGSRKVLSDVLLRYPDLIILSVEASRATLKHRLLSRGRETEAEVEVRLDRVVPPLPEGARVISIQNDGALEDAVAAVVAVFKTQEAPA